MRLAAPGVLGHYNHCEVTEVVGFPPGRAKEPVNVFSIIVFGERHDQLNESQKFLNSTRIRLPKLRDWAFGVCRYEVTPDRLDDAMMGLGAGNGWQLSGQSLCLGSLTPTRPQFVPPDATEESTLNRVLKNNFWNGSHVFELFDHQKLHVSPLIEEPPRLQQLSEALQQFVPIRLASLADRLGNILVQLPVRVLMCRFGFSKDRGIRATLAWDRRAQPRHCRVVSLMEFDGAIPGFGVSEISGEETEIDTGDSTHLNRNILWDYENQLILAASGPVASLRKINLSMTPVEAEPRVVVIPITESTVESHRVRVVSGPIDSRVGDADPFLYREWTHRRLYNEERRRLESERAFVQYGLSADKAGERQRALNDLRFLIDRHGRKGAWLWDPYLKCPDIMRTLFFCKYHGVELRALAAFENRTRQEADSDVFEVWREQQQKGFGAAGNNHYGLNLEFRARHGCVGWTFHDRFLIFPNSERGPLAWSLGTSINSLGERHHILQQVGNGQIIVDAFLDLWDKLDGEDYLVWRTP
jgi:hypothetical protein